jgi:F-type H+-transporting ATPase subunit gamma
MAGGVERALRTRIRSVDSTRKITRAMELIAASQIARARDRILGSAPYVDGIEQVLHAAAADSTGASRVIGDASDATKVLVVAIVADRGLCGGYNTAVLRTAERLIVAGEREGRSYRVVSVGRKAIGYFRFRGREVSRSFIAMTNRPSFEDARQVAAELVAPFLAGEVDSVQLISTRFRSAGVQEVETRQVLPLPERNAEGDTEAASATSPSGGFFDFEPDPAELLRLLVPRYAEAVIYRALLEASASEHTARQRAMAAATDNAEELITTYRRAMNRARQDSITTEILEIVSGAEALRADAAGRNGIDELSDEQQEQIA